MISKWENPSTRVRNEKEKKWAPTYIVPTHKTKHMGLKQLWILFLHKVEDLDFGWHFWLRGLIMNGDKI
jgi:hypothetical protein